MGMLVNKNTVDPAARLQVGINDTIKVLATRVYSGHELRIVEDPDFGPLLGITSIADRGFGWKVFGRSNEERRTIGEQISLLINRPEGKLAIETHLATLPTAEGKIRALNAIIANLAHFHFHALEGAGSNTAAYLDTQFASCINNLMSVAHNVATAATLTKEIESHKTTRDALKNTRKKATSIVESEQKKLADAQKKVELLKAHIKKINKKKIDNKPFFSKLPALGTVTSTVRDFACVALAVALIARSLVVA